MLFWIIQQTIISIILIISVHYIYIFFKNNLTVPKTKDLVKKPVEQYKKIYSTIEKSNQNNSNNESMKSELKNYLKQLSKKNDKKNQPSDVFSTNNSEYQGNNAFSSTNFTSY